MLWVEHCHHEQEYLNTEEGSGGGVVVLWVEHCHHDQEYLNTEGGSGGGVLCCGWNTVIMTRNI